MSKGGAGKVYFVLYLAVILELLIIIVERDEAEEHLMQKQKESMKIVQSILAQLQSGSGATGVNTRRSDEITLKGGQTGEGYDLIKEERRYFVDVGVTDVSSEITKVQSDPRLSAADKAKRFAELVDLSNARQLEYQIFYSNAKTDVIPEFPSEAEIKEYEKTRPFRTVGMAPSAKPEYSGWQLVALRQLSLDAEATKNQEPKAEAYKSPIYGGYDTDAMVGSIREFAPTQYEKTPINEQDIFAYSKEQTDAAAQALSGRYKKRTFVAYFKPKQDGWYKVRFSSKTNNILGVRGTATDNAVVSDEEEVNVGTVKLKVKELKAVRKEIARELEGTAVMAAATQLEQNPSRENLENFKKIVEEESSKAATSANEQDRERSGQMRVFSYIVQLLTPNATEFIDQNLSATEFDVRVVSAPKRQTGDPFVALEIEQLAVFDKAGEVRVPFTAGPMIGGAEPTVRVTSGSISATRGTATMSVASNQSQPTPAGGNNRTYDLVMSNLAPGQHTVEVSHTFPGAKGGPATQTFNLTVYETGLKSATVNNYLGGPVNFRFLPNSENAIAPSQFTSYVAVDGQQAEPFSGFTKKVFDVLPFTAKSVSYRVEWALPRYVKDKVVLGQDSKATALDPPAFQLPTQFNKSQYERNGTITFDVTIPAQQGVTVNVSATEVPGKVKLIGSPSVKSAGGNKYTVSFRVNARTVPPKGDLVTIRVSATASASSGANSDPSTKTVSIPVAPLKK
jgi:hypothetical protein